MCSVPFYLQVVRTIGFIEVGDKSVVWDNDIGPGEDIEHFILKFPIKSLVVPDAQLKFIIEKNLVSLHLP